MSKLCHKAKGKIHPTSKDQRMGFCEAVSRMAVQRRGAVVVEDVQNDKRFPHYYGKTSGVGSCLSLPMMVSPRKILGVLNIHKSEPRSFAKQEMVFYGDGGAPPRTTRIMLVAFADNNPAFDKKTGSGRIRSYLDAPAASLVPAGAV